MQLENQIAVRYKTHIQYTQFMIFDKIMTRAAFEQLQQRAQANQCVIIEAWEIGTGKCISN